jgi:peptidoglycan hydrolase CwlO-like protein
MSDNKDELEEGFGSVSEENTEFDFSDLDDEEEFDVEDEDIELSAFPDDDEESEFESASFEDDEDDFTGFDEEELGEVEDSDDEDEIEDSEDEFDLSDDSDEEDEFEEDDEEFDLSEDDSDVDDDTDKPAKNSNIMKYAFYLGTVAAVGAIGYVGVSMFAPNLLGGGNQQIQQTPPAINQQAQGDNNGIGNQQTPPMPNNQANPPLPNQNAELDKPALPGSNNQLPMENIDSNPLQNSDLNNNDNGDVDLTLESENQEQENTVSVSEEEINSIKDSIDDMGVAIGAVLNTIDSFENTFVSRNDLMRQVEPIIEAKISDGISGIDIPDSVSQSDLNSIENRFSADIRNLKVSLGEAVNALNKKDKEVSNANMRANEAAEQLSQMQSQFDAFLSEMDELETIISTQKAEISNLQEIIDKQNEALSKTEATVARVSRVQREQKREIDARNAIGGGLNPPEKPKVLVNYRLAGVARDMAWIETEGGVSRIRVGQSIPGLGVIEAIRPVNDNWAVVTPAGLILP